VVEAAALGVISGVLVYVVTAGAVVPAARRTRGGVKWVIDRPLAAVSRDDRALAASIEAMGAVEVDMGESTAVRAMVEKQKKVDGEGRVSFP